MSGWGCPHEDKGICTRLGGLPCSPGRKGCLLHGRFRFSTEEAEKECGQDTRAPGSAGVPPAKS